MVHQRNPNMAPDTEYELGKLSHLVEGNDGRLLDPRRTPVGITAILIQTGQFELEILDFEDKGARWVEDFENVGHYQFVRGSERRKNVETIQAAIDRFNVCISIPASGIAPPELDILRKKAAPYVNEQSFHLEAEVGCKDAWVALHAFMEELDLVEMEEQFARQFVSNPNSGELVKGHRQVIAEMGLVPYEGKMIRDPSIFDGQWNRKRRATHVCARLAFVRELFTQAGLNEVLLWRGMSTTTRLEPARNSTFVSTSFSRTVAESLFKGSDETRVGVLSRQYVPIERLFMTYIETEAMNQQFLEAEAILLFDNNTLAF